VLTLVIRKILSNSWKVLCLLLGSILVVAMVCSIPIFSNGILQRMLTKDLENLQTVNKRYPGYIVFSSNFSYTSADKRQVIDKLRTSYADLVKDMPAKQQVTLESIQVPNLNFKTGDSSGSSQSFSITSMTDFKSHVSMVKGRLFGPSSEDGVIEAVVTESAMKEMKLLLDHVYEIYSYRQKSGSPPLFKMKIVGLFTSSDSKDLYWYKHINLLNNTIMIDSDVMKQMMDQYNELVIGEHLLISAYDYHQFRIQDIGVFQSILEKGNDLATANKMTTKFITTFATVIDTYVVREAELKLTLQILIIPILLMLIYYVFMVSQLMVRSENNIISVLESRGAKRTQILAIYGLESLVYAVITFIIGPFLGLMMVRIIGASNGFLEFVSRKALQIEIDATVILYALIVVLLFMVTILIPVFIQSRTSIVEQKRRKSRSSSAPLWQKIFLDILLLAVSIYALYRLKAQMAIQKETGLSGLETNLDFLLYLSSTLFIIGAGLFFLRLYPWIIRLVYFIGRRFWNPVLYASFHQISRSGGQEQFLMLFLILALSIGLFNANAARTINRNTEDIIHNETGADIVVQEYWQQYDQNGRPIMPADPLTSSLDPTTQDGAKIIKYNEPDFGKYSDLAGVESAARVFRTSQASIYKDRTVTTHVMAVDPYDFAKTAWWRSDLARYHINEYMNVMMTTPSAVILSRNLKEELDLEVGDGIFYSLGGSDTISGVIIAFVDYWPGFEPVTVSPNSGSIRQESLIVANFEYMLSKSAIQPYEVWIKRASDVTDKIIYDDIAAQKIHITSIASANQMIVAAKNDPKLQGTNGALTLGFIVSMLICAAGFLIYWIMSVQGRVLQFGIFRAMGLSKAAVIGMLISEQVLISGVAILVGDVIGNISSVFFVPLFQLVYSSADQSIPFGIVSNPGDTTKIFTVLGVLLLVCFGVLTRLILRIKIDQAVKLGEE
jgi:putative ABC transport system permease protein